MHVHLFVYYCIDSVEIVPASMGMQRLQELLIAGWVYYAYLIFGRTHDIMQHRKT